MVCEENGKNAYWYDRGKQMQQKVTCSIGKLVKIWFENLDSSTLSHLKQTRPKELEVLSEREVLL